MEQMQNMMLNLLQSVSTQKTQPEKQVDSSQSGGSNFRKLMEDRTQQAQPNAETTKTGGEKAASESKASSKQEDEVDTAALQELAAMQMLCADTNPVIEAIPEPVQNVQTDSGLTAAASLEAGALIDQTVNTQTAVVRDLNARPEQSQTVEQTQTAQLPETAEAPVQMQEQGQGEAAFQQENSPSMKDRPSVAVKASSDEPTENAAAETPVFSKVETAPIKVSETTSTQASAEAQSVEDQVQVKVTEAITQGETRVELQLEPENLGKVTIELTQREDGTLHVVLHAENSQTRGLLEKDVFGLQALLSRDTQQQVQVEVPRHQESQRQDFDGHQQQNHQQQEQRQNRQSSDDFLNQLRLGLIPLDEAAS